MGKKAFIKGITGQDGSYLTEHLLDLGYEVYGFARRNSVTEHQQTRLENLMKNEGLDEIKSEKEIIEIIEKIIKDNSKQYEQYLNGKEKLFGFFVGQVMKETQGKANPQSVNEILKKLLA